MRTAKYRKRCFDQIEGIVAENKALAAKVDRLRSEVGEKVSEMSAQEEHRLELTRRLAGQFRQREGWSGTPSQLFVAALVDFADQRGIHVGLEEEVARLQQEKEQLSQELAGALEAGRRAGEELSRKDRELSGNTRRPVICRLSLVLIC